MFARIRNCGVVSDAGSSYVVAVDGAAEGGALRSWDSAGSRCMLMGASTRAGMGMRLVILAMNSWTKEIARMGITLSENSSPKSCCSSSLPSKQVPGCWFLSQARRVRSQPCSVRP